MLEEVSSSKNAALMAEEDKRATGIAIHPFPFPPISSANTSDYVRKIKSKHISNCKSNSKLPYYIQSSINVVIRRN